jgi:hypothetical protein
MDPPSLEYAAEKPTRAWPAVRTLGLVASAAAFTCLTVSVGMYVNQLPRRFPRLPDIQQALAWGSIALGTIGAIAALAALIRNPRGRMEWLALFASLSYGALLLVVLLYF